MPECSRWQAHRLVATLSITAQAAVMPSSSRMAAPSVAARAATAGFSSSARSAYVQRAALKRVRGTVAETPSLRTR
mgnify:CR=1 FL=1